MFEFHGWATIEFDETEGKSEFVRELRSECERLADGLSMFEVRELGNGLVVLLANGLRNHRRQQCIELFRFTAVEAPLSYGLLYVRDQEDAEHDNEFRAWRLARGAFEELADPFLSPCVPTIEEPSEWWGKDDEEE